jgi:hypothetical protein
MSYVYRAHDRINAQRALSEDEMRTIAPSIFAEQAHESRSERFRAIPTIEVLRGLGREGFVPVFVAQSRSRDETKRDFTKHLIRMRKLGTDLRVDDTFAEIVIKNANDGSSAYDLMAGLWRVRCMNGMVAKTRTVDEVKVRHSGDAVAKVIEGTYRVLGEAENLLAAPQDWGRVAMPAEARQALAEAAHVLRFGDAEGVVETPIQPTQLLAPRRADDRQNDLWTTFNVVQENVIRGGLRARAAATIDERGRRQRGRMVTTREVKGIDQDVKLNKALWVLGERMAQILKSAA